MKFEIEGSDSRVKIKSFLDKDGDFCVSVNGITILHISAGEGEIARYCLGSGTARILKSIGFRIDDLSRVHLKGE